MSAALRITCARCDDADALRAEADALRAENARLRTRLDTVVVLADVLAERAADYEAQAARELRTAQASSSERRYAYATGALTAIIDAAAGAAATVAQQIRCAATGAPQPDLWLAVDVDEAVPSTESDPTLLADVGRAIAEDHLSWCRGLVKP